MRRRCSCTWGKCRAEDFAIVSLDSALNSGWFSVSLTLLYVQCLVGRCVVLQDGIRFTAEMKKFFKFFSMPVKYSCSIWAKSFPSCCSKLGSIFHVVIVLTVRPLTRVIEQREHNWINQTMSLYCCLLMSQYRHYRVTDSLCNTITIHTVIIAYY